MNGTVLVLGASGQVGAAVMAVLKRDGWLVRAGARSRHAWPDGVTGVVVDREDDASLAGAVGSGVDLLVDCVAYDDSHARQITALADSVRSAVVLSSVSVYADERGRTLDEATGPDDFPVLPVPVGEDQATVPPGPATYSTRKAAMEQALLSAGAGLPVTVLRPGAISGPRSVHPRELWFVKRALDHRPVQILAHQGRSQFHTTSTPNLAELVRLAAVHPGSRVLNAVDPQPPTTAQIGAAVNALLDHHPRQVWLEGAPHPTIGQNPWAVPHPFVMDMTAAEQALGYQAPTSYADALPATVEWIRDELAERDWRKVFPAFLRANGPDAFNYSMEDTWLKNRATPTARAPAKSCGGLAPHDRVEWSCGSSGVVA